ncbi:transposase [Streptosporangium sp. NPDC020072]|uniref:transposase n=1 Tax=Streptosporangium sp. NPDC020072 TaxID=3154788 RepID=UPI0034130ABE
MARFDVTDAEWALIEPYLPLAATGPLPRRVQDQFNGILWRFRTGSGWRDVPERHGSWSTLCSPFNGWAKAPESYEAGLHLRGSIMWLKLLTSTT